VALIVDVEVEGGGGATLIKGISRAALGWAAPPLEEEGRVGAVAGGMSSAASVSAAVVVPACLGWCDFFIFFLLLLLLLLVLLGLLLPPGIPPDIGHCDSLGTAPPTPPLLLLLLLLLPLSFLGRFSVAGLAATT